MKRSFSPSTPAGGLGGASPPAETEAVLSAIAAPLIEASTSTLPPASPSTLPLQARKNGAEEVKTEKKEVETVTLSDTDSEGDCVVVEPSKVGKGKRKEEEKEVKMASIFTPRKKVKLSSPPPATSTITPSKADVKPKVATPSSFLSPSTSAPAQTTTEGQSLDTPLPLFHPHLLPAWPSSRVPYSFLTSAFVLLSSTKKRLTIQRVLVNLLRSVLVRDPESLLPVIYLLTNSLGPAHQKNLEMGIGPSVLNKAIKDLTSISPAGLKSLWKKFGDPGDVGAEASNKVRLLVRPQPLICYSLYAKLLSLTKLKGAGSLAQKSSIVHKLLISSLADPNDKEREETKYLIRTLGGNLRVGANRRSCLGALGRAFCWEEERRKVEAKGKEVGEEVGEEMKEKLDEAESILKKVWARCPSFDLIVPALLSSGVNTLEETLPLRLGTPIQPMLGNITRSLESIWEKFGEGEERGWVSEAKLDGQRAQIHVRRVSAGEGKMEMDNAVRYGVGEGEIEVRVFSRNLEDMSDKYPDLLPTLSEIVARSSLNSFIIDAEIVAIDPVSGAFRTFQELSYRSKKDVEMGDIKVRVGVYAFDVMYLNGESLLAKPFRGRRNLLKEFFGPVRPNDPRSAKWELVPSCESHDRETVKKFFEDALEMKAEGIMVKLLDEIELSDVESDSEEKKPTMSPGKAKGKKKVLPATYEPDKRADSWLKVKKDYLDDLGDSLDLVPIGAWHGMGRKKDWWSPILMGVYDEDTGEWNAVCKIMSGFTDQFYKDLHVRYAEDGENTSFMGYSEVNVAGVKPSIYFKPSEVWEVRGADFTLSPVYPAAQGLVSERGISIRFPRFLRIRDPSDKGIEDCTSVQQLADLYRKYADSGGGKGNIVEAEDEDEE